VTAEPELACRELVELVTEYLEGALDAAERARVEDHLGDCDGCRAHLRQGQATVTVLGRLFDHPGDHAPSS
jgi:anti-sigma factor RsiW